MDKLSLDEVPIEEPKAGEILVRMRAVSLNYREVLVTMGRYAVFQSQPLVLGSDGAGEVIAVGPGVIRWKTGDES